MNSFWNGFTKTAGLFSNLRKGFKVEHSFSPQAAEELNKAIHRLENIVNVNLLKTLNESKKFKAQDVIIPAVTLGIGVGGGLQIGKKMGRNITDEHPTPKV